MAVDSENGEKKLAKITLYSTGCPKCKVLETKLRNNHIGYRTITDRDEMLQKGFTKVPILEVDNNFLDFYRANNWINERVAHLNEYTA